VQAGVCTSNYISRNAESQAGAELQALGWRAGNGGAAAGLNFAGCHSAQMLSVASAMTTTTRSFSRLPSDVEPCSLT